MSIHKDDFLDLLEEYMLSEEAKELEIKITGDAEADAPIIDSQEKANYFLKLIINLNKDIDNINEICDNEIKKTTERVNSFREEKLSTLLKQKTYYEGLLRNYTEHAIRNQKKKSVSLPYGTIGLKAQSPKWEYDESILLDWIKENNPNLVNEKVTYSVNKKELKQLADIQNNIPVIDGVEVPGITITPQKDKFDIKIK